MIIGGFSARKSRCSLQGVFQARPGPNRISSIVTKTAASSPSQIKAVALPPDLRLPHICGGAVIYAVNVATGSRDGAMVETTVIRGRTSRY